MSKFIVILLALLNLRECIGVTLRGTRATEGQFPWLVQFQTIVPCGGILVSPDWVLTAAQCVQYKRNSITVYAAGLNGTGSGQTLGVKATYIYPLYEPYSTKHDHVHNIALLKLMRAFDMCDEGVRLVDVAPVRLDDNYRSCLIFGWESYVAPSTKVLGKPVRYSQVLLNSWKLCMYILKGNTSYDNVFCTIVDSEEGMKACAGNPGSPVVCEDHYQKMVLLGIASWSNFSLDCGGLPTYLGVNVFRSWMNELIFNDKKREDCDNASKSNQGTCNHDRYVEDVTPSEDVHNHTDPLQLGHQSPERSLDSGKVEPVHRSWIPSSSKPARKTLLDSAFDLSRMPEIPPGLVLSSYQDTRSSRLDLVRARDDNLKLYQEIGRSKDVFSRMDEVVAMPAEHGGPRYLSKPLTEKTSAKRIDSSRRNADIDNLDDLDFTIPLNYDDGGRSSCGRLRTLSKCFPVLFLAVYY